MFEVPGSDTVAVTVDRDAVLGISPPQYTYKSPSDDTSTSESQAKTKNTNAL